MRSPPQELHLWTVRGAAGAGAACADAPPGLRPFRLAFAPARLVILPSGPHMVDARAGASAGGVLLEPILNSQRQLRLFASFPGQARPMVNGEPTPEPVVLAPGDFFQWGPNQGCYVVLFSRPQVGPAPAAMLGKACPVCRVPFAASATSYACACGALLHCESSEKEGLQCAQMRRECPVCGRAVVLAEGYVNPPNIEG